MEPIIVITSHQGLFFEVSFTHLLVNLLRIDLNAFFSSTPRNPVKMSSVKSFVDSTIKQYKVVGKLDFLEILWVNPAFRLRKVLLPILQEGKGGSADFQVQGRRIRMDRYWRSQGCWWDTGLSEGIDWRKVAPNNCFNSSNHFSLLLEPSHVYSSTASSLVEVTTLHLRRTTARWRRSWRRLRQSNLFILAQGAMLLIQSFYCRVLYLSIVNKLCLSYSPTKSLVVGTPQE